MENLGCKTQLRISAWKLVELSMSSENNHVASVMNQLWGDVASNLPEEAACKKGGNSNLSSLFIPLTHLFPSDS